MHKILIVDDSQSFLDLAYMMLKDNFDLEFATTAIEALKLIKSFNYDAIILDVSLPDYTGYWLGEQVRKIHTEIPLVFLTNYDGEVTRENADLLGATFWFKPNMIDSKNIFQSNIEALITDVEEKRNINSTR